MLSFPNPKINIGLYVARKRDDGYHDIETVFYPLAATAAAGGGQLLQDVLEIVPAHAETKLQLSGLAVNGSNTDNLVMKAYRLLHQQFPEVIPPLDIYLHKIIPMGAGLGGGSADGAFMLRLMNDNFRLGLSTQELAAFALQLGSDCPFFIYNSPQFATGRGEHMTHVAIDLSAYSIQVICPQVHVSTAKAFAMMAPKPAPIDLSHLSSIPVNEWKARISNDFERPVFEQHPVLASIKQQLYEQGAIYASMSGSGSALYGIFEKGRKAEIMAGVRFEDFFVT